LAVAHDCAFYNLTELGEVVLEGFCRGLSARK
jgi:hypothetical protein